MLRTALKAVAWLIGGLAALLVAAYAAALAVNAHDEPPSAAALRFTDLRSGLPVVLDEDNALVELRRIAANRTGAPPAGVAQVRGACGTASAECTQALAAAPLLVEEWTAAEPDLLPRYLALLERPAWREEMPEDPARLLPALIAALDAQRLSLLWAYSLAERGDAALVNDVLGDDARFWRRMLETSDSVTTKMIAAAALRQHFHFGSVVLRRADESAAAEVIPTEWKAPITAAERTLMRCLAGEWWRAREALQSLDWMAREVWYDRAGVSLFAPLYQPQATMNRLAEHYWAVAQTFEAPLERYPAALEQASALTGERQSARFERGLYNAMGALLFGAAPDFKSNAVRLADLEGVRRAALATVSLRASGVVVGDIEAALAASELRNPYTGEPFEWNAAERAIVFRGLEAAGRMAHSFYY